MGILDYFRKKKVDSIVEKVNKKNIGKRYCMLILGTLIVAFSFNLFFLRYNLACFGVSGISIILSKFGVNPSIFILVCNILLMILAYFTLGLENTKRFSLSNIVAQYKELYNSIV